MLPVVPMFHANGWAIPFLAPMAGASLVMPGPKLDGASLYRIAGRANASPSPPAVPTVWLDLLQYLEEQQTQACII